LQQGHSGGHRLEVITEPLTHDNTAQPAPGLDVLERIRAQVADTWGFGGSDEKVEALAYVLRLLDAEVAHLRGDERG
jgi:hypothetical protein